MSRATPLRPKKADAALQRLPVVQQMLQALTHDDETLRAEARKVAVGTLRGKPRAVIIDGLVGLLRHPGADVRLRAAEALVAFGTAAIPSLLIGLWKRDAPAWQVRLAQVLTAIVPQVPPAERMKLFLEVDRALWQATDKGVVRALMELQAALVKGVAGVDQAGLADHTRRQASSAGC